MKCDDDAFKALVNFVSKYEFGKSEIEAINGEMLCFLRDYSLKHELQHVKELRVHVKEYHVRGTRKEYELEALFLTNKERFHAEKKGWNPVEVTSDLMSALKKQVNHKYER